MSEQAGISKGFTKHFLLDESKLRKLCDVIREHSEKLKERTYLKLWVRREDNSYYETKNIDEVLKDDNIPGKALQRLIIHLLKEHPDKDKATFNSGDKIKTFVAFTLDQDEKVSFGIEETERDWCFLLADDLDTQIQRTLKKRTFPFFTSRLFETAVFLALGAFFKLWLSFVLTLGNPDISMDSIQSMTTEMQIEKILEIHLERDIRANWLTPAILFSWVLILVLIEIRPITRIIEKLNRSVFYWGDMKTQYQNFLAKVNRFKWGVVITFIMSILAGLFVMFVFK